MKQLTIEQRWQVWQAIEPEINKRLVLMTPEQQAQILWIKTALYYEFALSRAIRKLYNDGNQGLGEYIDTHARLIREQLEKAWREGMREVGVSPDEMTEEERSTLEGIIANEENHVLGFADEILTAAANDSGYSSLVSRARVWANRYNEVANLAKVMAARDKKFEWVLGPTEHCDSCSKLAGIVKRGSVWEAAGIRPQNPPNPSLQCEGWNCQCRLLETDAPARRGPFPRLP